MVKKECYELKNFIVYEENKEAYDVALKIIEGSISNKLIMFYGNKAIGKTHLLNIIANGLKNNKSVLYITSEEFIKDVIDLNKRVNFLEKYSNTEVLIVDDIQYFTGNSMYELITSGKELEFKKVIEDLKKVAENVTLTELVDKILDTTGYRQELENEKTLEADIRLENLEEFKSITKAFEERDGVISLEDFLFEVSLVSDREEYKDAKDKVSLMTVHSVKGLEFNDVFVIGLEEGIFPHMNSLMDNQDLEEERRLAYVAITRAKERLYLVNARRRMLYGKDQVNPPSRFIGEIDKELISTNTKEEKPQEIKIDKQEKFYSEDVDWKVGDYAYHDVFGAGRVVEVTNTLISIAFKSPHGIKKLMKNHKSLKKV